jgi:hypothetical protein
MELNQGVATQQAKKITARNRQEMNPEGFVYSISMN